MIDEREGVRLSFLTNRNTRFLLLWLLVILGACLGLAGSAHAATFTVSTTTDTADKNPGDGLCADASNQCSVRAALMEANVLAGEDVINIPPSTYTLTTGQQLEIKDQVKLIGESNDPTNTIIQAAVGSAAAATSRVLEINPALNGTGYDVTIQGLTIRHGKAPDYNGFGGGGIGGDVGVKTLTISHSVIEKNIASGNGFGGGLFISGASAGKVQLTDVAFNNNIAGDPASASYGSQGGAIYLEGDMSLAMSNLTVQNNTSYGLGGGVAIVSESQSARTVTINASTITGNKAISKTDAAEGRAGGLYLGTPAAITDTTLANNIADGDGGGVVLDFFAGSVSLTNVTITSNKAARGGGMFVNANKAPNLTNTSITGNTGGNVAINPEGADMQVAIAPNGAFSQGKTGAHYSVTVRNNSILNTKGTLPVTVTLTLPTGLTATKLAGSGWTCPNGTLTCTRSDILSAQSDYPVIDVTVDVAANALHTVTSTAQVSSGDELELNNNTSSYDTTVFSKDATLKELTPVEAAFKETFAPGTLAYTADVSNVISSLSVTPTATDSRATIKVNGNAATSGNPVNVPLIVGSNQIKFDITAEDGLTKLTYTVTITRPASSNANLGALTLSAGTLAPTFASGTLNYTAIVGSGVATVDVTPTASNSMAIIKVNGNVATSGNPLALPLSMGSNLVTIDVTAEDTTTKLSYTIEVMRVKSNNANLGTLTLSGGVALNEQVDPNTLNYTASVGNEVTALTLTPAGADPKATVTVNGKAASEAVDLKVGLNEITVVVTAEDTTTTKTYKVTVTRAASSNANLGTLTLSAGVALNEPVDPNTANYTASVGNEVTAITLTPTGADPKATVTVNGKAASEAVSLNVGSNEITVVVTAEDTTTTKTYKVTVTRASSSNANLGTLTLSGGVGLNEQVDPNTLDYTANVGNEVTAITLTPTGADPKATVTVNGKAASEAVSLNVGPNEITVVVTAEDTTTTKTYKVTVTRMKSNNASLGSLTLSGGVALNEQVDPNTLNYTASVGNEVTAITLTPAGADPKATVTVNGKAASEAINLHVGPNEITVVVTAEDTTTTKTYKVTVTRAASNNANLGALTLSGGVALNEQVDPNTANYTASVGNEVTAITLTPIGADPKATVTVNGKAASEAVGLNVGSNEILIVVTAEDGMTKKVYKVTVTRLSNNTDLKELLINMGKYTKNLTEDITKGDYATSVTNAVYSVNVTAVVYDPKSTLQVNGNTILSGVPSEAIQLAEGTNDINITVIAEDRTPKNYKVTITRNGNAELKGLIVSGVNLSPPFNLEELSYAGKVPYEVSSTTVTASVYDSNATLFINGKHVPTGIASSPIDLLVGLNKIPVVVTPKVGGAPQVYTIEITRSGSAELKELTVSGVNLSPLFNGSTMLYTGSVPYEVSSTTVTASVYDARAKILINDVEVPDGKGSSPINLAVGENTIRVAVTPIYGVPQAPYTIKITRGQQSTHSDSGSAPTSNPAKVRVKLYIGGSGKALQLDVQRERTTDGRVTDKVVITHDIFKEATEGAVGSEQKTLNLAIPELLEGSDEFNVIFPMNILQDLSGSGMSLSIETNDVQITLPGNTVSGALQSNEDLYVRFVPIRTDAAKQETEKRVLTAQIVTKAAGSGKVDLLGLPMTIESNLKNQETRLSFSLKGIQIPTDPKKRSEFLSSLGVYIEHSDGEKELLKGIIKYDSKGNPIGIEIVITKFSTFSLIEVQKIVIDTVTYKRWIEGYPDGTFKPNQPITRSEAAAIFVKAITLPKSSNDLQKFNDVTDDHWAADAIHQVQGAGLLSGYPDGSFKPDARITRAELATIIVRINKLGVAADGKGFTDTQGHWAAGYIQAAKAAGLMSGYEDGSFRPDQQLTRAEAVKVINTLLKRPTPNLSKKVWKDVDQKDWFWLDVQSASASFSHTLYEDGSNSAVVIP
ncbi:cadherin-like beta sandwich domain-containing protein [Paenibacillus sp. SI8]|uniref:cadherin-like beta sandwich domain-containing protein n=1 Tax=unclassified Paenibacillus TaxID=185978 RepID=UPI003465E8C7